MRNEDFKPSQPVYFTVIEDRRPKRKFHEGIGQAKNAVGYSFYGQSVRGGQIWQVAEPENILLYDVEPRSLKENLPWRN